MKRVLVVIPAFNEAPVIADVVKGARELFEKDKSAKIDILVVDDRSSDATASEAKKSGAKVISHILNTGAGGATLTGLGYARQNDYDIVATMDADGQHSAKDVLVGIKKMLGEEDIDLLIGSRLINSDGMSKTKVIGNKGLSTLTHLLFGIDVTDSQSGLRIYSKEALNNLEWKSSGYEFCSEMIWRAKQANLQVSEYPIEAIYTDYSRGKGQNNWNAINIIKQLVKQRLTEILE